MLQQGFRTFLSTTATVDGWSADGTECNLVRTATAAAFPVHDIRAMWPDTVRRSWRTTP